MDDNKKIYKGAIIYSIGNFGSKCISFIMFPIYSYYLTTSEYGEYDLIVSTLMLLLPCLTLQMPSAIMKFMNEEDKSSVVSSSLAVCLICEIVVVTIGLLISLVADFAAILVFWLAIKLLHEFVLQIVRGLNKNLIYSLSSIFSSGVTLIGSIVLLIGLRKGISGLIISSFIGELSAVFFLILNSRMYQWISLSAINKYTINKMIRFSMPLIPCAMIWWVMNSSDRYVIKHYMGMDYNGIYSISNKFPAIVVLLYGFYNLSWQDFVYSSQGKKDYKIIIEQFMDLLVYASVVIMYVAKIFSLYFVDIGYRNSYLYIPPLIMAMIFYSFSGFWGVVYRKQNDTKKELSSSVIGAIVNLTVNILFIKHIGLWSAALSTTVSFLIVFVSRYKSTNSYLGYNFGSKTNVIRLIYISIFSLLYYLNSFWSLVSMCIISIVVFVIANKQTIKDIVSSFIYKK